MAHILYNGIKFHWNFKLLAPGFRAITLFGHVFTRMSKSELEDYLKTYDAKVTANHERIHMMQADSFKLKYFTFYIKYLYYWVKNLFELGCKNNIAYYNIPFEREAYKNERDFDYKETHWKDYK